MCIIDVGEGLRLPSALLEEGCVHRPSQAEFQLCNFLGLSHLRLHEVHSSAFSTRAETQRFYYSPSATVGMEDAFPLSTSRAEDPSPSQPFPTNQSDPV